MKKEKNSNQPVFSIDTDSLLIPKSEDIKRLITELKAQKKALFWADNKTPQLLLQWADTILPKEENKWNFEPLIQSTSKLLIIQSERKTAELLQLLFPHHTIIFLNAQATSSDEELLIKLYNALYYELPESDNILTQNALTTKIVLSDIKVFAYHGVLPEERVIGTNYLVSVEAEANLQKATETDNLEDTISYADLNELIHEEMSIPSQLIEHIAGRIFRRVKIRFPQILALKVQITKLSAPMQGENSGASFIIEKRF